MATAGAAAALTPPLDVRKPARKPVSIYEEAALPPSPASRAARPSTASAAALASPRRAASCVASEELDGVVFEGGGATVGPPASRASQASERRKAQELAQQIEHSTGTALERMEMRGLRYARLAARIDNWREAAHPTPSLPHPYAYHQPYPYPYQVHAHLVAAVSGARSGRRRLRDDS